MQGFFLISYTGDRCFAAWGSKTGESRQKAGSAGGRALDWTGCRSSFGYARELFSVLLSIIIHFGDCRKIQSKYIFMQSFVLTKQNGWGIVCTSFGKTGWNRGAVDKSSARKPCRGSDRTQKGIPPKCMVLRHSACVGQEDKIRLTVMVQAMERYSYQCFFFPHPAEQSGEWRTAITAFSV